MIDYAIYIQVNNAGVLGVAIDEDGLKALNLESATQVRWTRNTSTSVLNIDNTGSNILLSH